MNFKKVLSLLSLSLMLMSSCSETDKAVEQKNIVLQNKLEVDRLGEIVIVPAKKINDLLGEVKEGANVYFESQNGDAIPFQYDVINGEGEYALEVDFKANEEKNIVVNTTSEKIEDFKHYTNIRLGRDADFDGIYDDVKEEVRDPNHLPGSVPVLYQMEGISWENDKVGYRSYWDKRNGKDIWGKTTSEMVMDSVGLPNTPSYHEIQPWGVDVLKVGNSLGAGALAMVKDGELFRLGDTQKATMEILAEGPTRAILQLVYDGWEVKGESYSLTQTITILKGKYWYQSDVVISGKDVKDISLVTGITNIALKDKKYTKLEEGVKTLVYTHGDQTELQKLMGLGLILNSSDLNKVVEAPNKGTGRSIDGSSPISHTFYTVINKGTRAFSFQFATGWELSDDEFKTAQGFENMLVKDAKELNSPIVIK
ncbi:MAG: DUF4861 family protein [Bacteroidota bacterium]